MKKADYQYGYDANGNRTSTTIGGTATTASFTEVDEQLTWNTGLNRTYTYNGLGDETGAARGRDAPTTRATRRSASPD